MIDLDELMRLREAATPGPWKKMLPTVIVTDNPQSSYIIPVCTVLHDNHAQAENDAAYIVAACNAAQELVARIRELEAQRDWMAQAAANAGWHGVRVGKKYMIDQARIAVSRAQAEQHECPTPEVSCHARDGKLCMSDNHLACAQAADKDSFIMRRFTEVK